MVFEFTRRRGQSQGGRPFKHSMGCYSEYGAHPVDNAANIHGTGVTRQFSTLMKNSQRRDTANAILGCQLLIVFGVNFQQAHPGFQLSRSLREGWCHHLAGAAPGGPEIDHQGYITTLQMSRKITGIDLDGLAIEYRLMTLATIGGSAQTIRRQAVNRPTMGADQMDGFAHIQTTVCGFFINLDRFDTGFKY
jgi:hypothetical protein